MVYTAGINAARAEYSKSVDDGYETGLTPGVSILFSNCC